MAQPFDPTDLLGRRPDERLLGRNAAELPEGEQRVPPQPAPSPGRGALLAAGVTLTGVTLVAGTALIILAVVQAIVGDAGWWDLVAGLVGALLAGTHWGWVHVAEITAQALQARHERPARDAAAAWLERIEPYPRQSIVTEVADDGAIRILRVAHRPVAARPDTFSFQRETTVAEICDPERPGAEVAERVEALRRAAARETARGRERYRVAADAYEAALLHRDDARDRDAARRAASRALSERINAHLREPPLGE